MPFHPDGPEGEEVQLDFTPPWERLPMVDTIEARSGEKLPKEFDSESAQLRTPGRAGRLGEILKIASQIAQDLIVVLPHKWQFESVGIAQSASDCAVSHVKGEAVEVCG